MQVTFDTSLKIAGLGASPWSRIGLERWLPDYAIVATEEGGASGLNGMPPLYVAARPKSGIKGTRSLVNSRDFRQLAENELKDYLFLPYKPVAVEDQALQTRLLMNAPAHTATFENKAWLREHFADTLPFAPFVVMDRSKLQPTKGQYEKLQQHGGAFVMQHESLSGGKGTHIVHNHEEYYRALESLPPGKIVVSELIEGAVERSLQCCVARHGVVTARLQKQLVRAPRLTSPLATDGFSGGEIGTVTATLMQQEIVDRCVQAIGGRMQSVGFKGIFGLDFLFRGDEVFLLEVNARITGMTPLLTALGRLGAEVPLYLIHALELARVHYTLADGELVSPEAGAMLVLRHRGNEPVEIRRLPAAGVYRLAQGRLVLQRRDVAWHESDPPDVVLLQPQLSPGKTVRPGERLLAAFVRRPVLDARDVWLPEAGELIEALYHQIETPSKRP